MIFVCVCVREWRKKHIAMVWWINHHWRLSSKCHQLANDVKNVYCTVHILLNLFDLHIIEILHFIVLLLLLLFRTAVEASFARFILWAARKKWFLLCHLFKNITFALAKYRSVKIDAFIIFPVLYFAHTIFYFNAKIKRTILVIKLQKKKKKLHRIVTILCKVLCPFDGKC